MLVATVISQVFSSRTPTISISMNINIQYLLLFLWYLILKDFKVGLSLGFYGGKGEKQLQLFKHLPQIKYFIWLLSTFVCCFLSASSSLFGRVLVWSLNTSLRANNFGRFYSIQSFVCGRGGKITCMLHHCHHHYFHHHHCDHNHLCHPHYNWPIVRF